LEWLRGFQEFKVPRLHDNGTGGGKVVSLCETIFYCIILLYITTITVTYRNKDRWLAVVNAVMNLRVPQNVRNVLTSRDPVSFSRRTLFLGVRKEEITLIIAVINELQLRDCSTSINNL
jgi:hypothetical protein